MLSMKEAQVELEGLEFFAWIAVDKWDKQIIMDGLEHEYFSEAATSTIPNNSRFMFIPVTNSEHWQLGLEITCRYFMVIAINIII